MTEPEYERITCAVCGDAHVNPDTAIRLGLAWIAKECQWTMRYPGKPAHEVIEMLEQRLGGQPLGVLAGDVKVGEVAKVNTDGTVEVDMSSEAPTQVMEAVKVSDDPAERVERNQYVQEVLCSVCGGDGELASPETEGSVVPCGRCNGTGRITVDP